MSQSQQYKSGMKLLLTLWACFISYSVMAQSSSGSMSDIPVTQITKSSTVFDKTLDKFKKNSSVSLFSIFNGPGVTNLSLNQVDGRGEIDPDSSINNWIQVSYRYKLTDDISFVINPRFTYNFTTNQGTPNTVQALNPVFGFNGLWYKNGNFKVAGVLQAMLLNLEDGTRDEGLVLNPGAWLDITYRVNSDITLGGWFLGSYDFFRDNTDKQRFGSIWSPRIDWTITDQFLVRAWVEVFIDHTQSNSNPFASRRGGPENIAVGFEYNSESGFGIFPYVLTYGADNYRLASATIGAWIYGLVF